MSSKAMSLKGRIKNYAKSNNIAAQVVLQNYMFERFLERLSVSEYSEKFVVKGGMLIAAIVGLDTRSTMDLDTTLRNLPLTEEQISEALSSICKIDLNDDVSFEIKSVAPIRKDDVYGDMIEIIEDCLDAIEPFMEEVMPKRRKDKYYDYSDMEEIDGIVDEYLLVA